MHLSMAIQMGLYFYCKQYTYFADAEGVTFFLDD